LLTAEVISFFQSLNPSKTLIITIGNSWRGDDGVGVYIYEKFPEVGFTIINGGDKPENLVLELNQYQAEQVLIIDAADFGGYSGEVKLIPPESIPDTTLSTHTFPIKVVAKLIAKETGANVSFLGIQPKIVGVVDQLSVEVKTSAEELLALLGSKIYA
jgi:hydrogenase 3 maturation protease